MPAFDALVNLVRISTAPTVAATDLLLSTTSTAQSIALVQAIEGAGWDTTLRVEGAVVSLPVERLAHGQRFELVVHGMTRTAEVVTNNVGMLLKYNFGAFLGSVPAHFFLIQEDYASGEAVTHPDVQAYLRAVRILDLVKRLADVVRDQAHTAGEAIFLTTRKLSMPLAYDSRVLSSIASDSEIDRFQAAVFEDHHGAARKDIAKRVLVRFLDTVADQERFADLLKRLPQMTQAILADFDLFVSGFNFDKAREEFERKELDFVVKTNASSSDAMNKLIAIPIGQGLLASQMKMDAAYVIINNALLLASIVFAIIAAMLLASHILTLRQIGAELRTEKRLLQERAAPTYEQLRPMIGELENRIWLHVWGVPIALGTLLALTTLMTVLTYFKLTP